MKNSTFNNSLKKQKKKWPIFQVHSNPISPKSSPKKLKKVKIIPQLYYMSFPKQDQIPKLAQHMNQKFKGYYFIWNLSEFNYDIW